MAKLFGLFDSNEKEVKRLRPYVDEANALEEEFKALSDDALKAKTAEFRETIKAAAAKIQPRLDEAQKDLDDARLSVSGADWEGAKDEADKNYRAAQDRLKQAEKERNKIEQEALNDILPQAFAAVREAARRTLGQRHYDVQLLGGVTLHLGKIAEMRTGEGKTLVATLPLYLNCLNGRGSHLCTVNDYLARRDPYWMGPVYHALGVTVTSIYPMQNPQEQTPACIYDPSFDSGKDKDPWKHFRPISRKEAYEADITYGTSAEFGFDYLRDNMVMDLAQCVQRPLNYCIVDEVDNLLIDEARTPLIISAPDVESGILYQKFAQLVLRLKRDEDYEVNEKEHSADLTDEGWEHVENMLRRDNLLKTGDSLYNSGTLMHHLRNALSAKEFYHRDKEYVVEGPEVIIVDEFTGRKMYGRRYSEGLHQAIEAQEHIKVQQESKTYATITIQNYFRMYQKLGGMTGTAATEAEEFFKIYKLEVTEIPTNKPMIREDLPDQIYKTEEGKFRAVVREIKALHDKGVPVLVGTVSIEKSVLLSDLLKRQGITCQVLNAKEHLKEAEIVRHAGESGMVTVATNMAGRGVDIILGGTPPDYRPYEYIEQYFNRKMAEFALKAGSLLKDQLGYTQWREIQLTKLYEKRDELQKIGDKISKTYISTEIPKDDEKFDQEVPGLIEICRKNTKEVITQFFSLEDEIEQKLLYVLKENEKPEKSSILQKIKDIISKKHKREEIESEIDAIIQEYKKLQEWRQEHLRIASIGGLHIFGTERHEARRIDNQLRGRAGRQGDPGSSRFFISLEDDIMRRFGGDRLKTVMGWVGLDEETPIENKIITNMITDVQKRVEGYHFDVRKNLVEYDEVLNTHREFIYMERRKVLGGADLKSNIIGWVHDEIQGIVDVHAAENFSEGTSYATMLNEVHRFFPVPPEINEKSVAEMSKQEIEQKLCEAANAVYEQREAKMGGKMRLVERIVMLQIIDQLWVEHLTAMERERLQAGWQQLRQMKSSDAYKIKGHQMFEEELKPAIRRDVVNMIFHVEIKDKAAPAVQSPMAIANTGSKGDKAPAKTGSQKVGRNDPCPCGSGKKYKHCHGK
jgi:preprotein translocase subunit SecA